MAQADATDAAEKPTSLRTVVAASSLQVHHLAMVAEQLCGTG